MHMCVQSHTSPIYPGAKAVLYEEGFLHLTFASPNCLGLTRCTKEHLQSSQGPVTEPQFQEGSLVHSSLLLAGVVFLSEKQKGLGYQTGTDLG